jgi:hypothetical protein
MNESSKFRSFRNETGQFLESIDQGLSASAESSRDSIPSEEEEEEHPALSTIVVDDVRPQYSPLSLRSLDSPSMRSSVSSTPKSGSPSPSRSSHFSEIPSPIAERPVSIQTASERPFDDSTPITRSRPTSCSSHHLVNSHNDYINQQKAKIFAKWQRCDNDDETLRSSQDSVTAFKPPPYQPTGIKRSPPPPSTPPPPEIYTFSPEELPSRLKNRMLLAKSRRLFWENPTNPEEPSTPPHSLSRKSWEGFLERQDDLNAEKEQREWKTRKRACKMADGPIYEKLYRDSINRSPPVSPSPTAARELRFSQSSQEIAAQASPRSQRTQTPPQQQEIEERFRDSRFSPNSRELAANKPKLMKRIEQTLDLKEVLHEELQKRRAIRERTEYYANRDE